mmetsp:Transcript_26590/g.89480  ORF Transcript_26590/g.89480 Transcript_26590/m.89480 type:complete len:357 (+) Transcript_26590:2755-3825(+)
MRGSAGGAEARARGGHQSSRGAHQEDRERAALTNRPPARRRQAQRANVPRGAGPAGTRVRDGAAAADGRRRRRAGGGAGQHQRGHPVGRGAQRADGAAGEEQGRTEGGEPGAARHPRRRKGPKRKAGQDAVSRARPHGGARVDSRGKGADDPAPAPEERHAGQLSLRFGPPCLAAHRGAGPHRVARRGARGAHQSHVRGARERGRFQNACGAALGSQGAEDQNAGQGAGLPPRRAARARELHRQVQARVIHDGGHPNAQGARGRDQGGVPHARQKGKATSHRHQAPPSDARAPIRRRRGRGVDDGDELRRRFRRSGIRARRRGDGTSRRPGRGALAKGNGAAGCGQLEAPAADGED